MRPRNPEWNMEVADAEKEIKVMIMTKFLAL